MHLGMGGSEVKAMLFCASAYWGQVRRCGRGDITFVPLLAGARW
jgi:hypothetical protein